MLSFSMKKIRLEYEYCYKSLLYTSKNDVTFKITIEFVIDHY
jgi:hypothetical protein